MSGYGKIGNMRVLDIIVVNKNNETLFEGRVEDAPPDIKELEYTGIEVGNPTKLYV